VPRWSWLVPRWSWLVPRWSWLVPRWSWSQRHLVLLLNSPQKQKSHSQHRTGRGTELRQWIFP